MKKQLIKLLVFGLFITATGNVFAQSDWNTIDSTNILSRDTIAKGKYTLVFINKDTALDATVKKRLIETFFTVYPKEAKQYNSNTANKVTFIIDSAYDGVAATAGDIVRFNPAWFHKHPQDIDVVTHEVMHIVQAYPDEAGPGWITEGIADYVRYKFGVNNAAAGWKLPEYNAKQNYDNSYRITARFFVWIEKNYNKDFVQKLDAAMRSKKYTNDFCKNMTGKTFEQLWSEYAKNPSI